MEKLIKTTDSPNAMNGRNNIFLIGEFELFDEKAILLLKFGFGSAAIKSDFTQHDLPGVKKVAEDVLKAGLDTSQIPGMEPHGGDRERMLFRPRNGGIPI